MAMANRHYIPGRAGKHVSREAQGERGKRTKERIEGQVSIIYKNIKEQG